MFRLLAPALLLAAFAAPTGLALAAAAPPAEARAAAPARATTPVVEDPDGVLADGQADALRGKLAGLPLKGVAVVFSRREGDGIERLAEDAFRRLRLGPGALTVAIAVGDRKVAAHVGQDLRSRGIDREVIQATIGARFKAHARAGRYDEGAFALADGLARHEGSAAARSGDRPARPAPPRPAEKDDEPVDGTSALIGLGLFLVFLGVPAVGLLLVVWWVVRLFRKSWKEVGAETTAQQRARLATLEGARDRIMAGVVALDGAMALARAGGEDPSQETATAVMAEAQTFSTRVDAAVQQHAGGREVEAGLEADALEMIALNLEISLAALRTAYQDGDHGRFRDALKLGRRWKLVDAQVAHLVEKNLGKAKKRAVLVDLVAKAREALVGVPMDVAYAEALIAEVEATLEKLGLTKIEDEPAASATSRVPASTSHHGHLDCWDVTPIHVYAVSHAVASHGHATSHQDHHDSSADTSGSSWWGSSSSSSDSSGSSSWSSSSSDDDSNRWSSSDSGSSSWDSGSSSSSDSSSSSGSDSW